MSDELDRVDAGHDHVQMGDAFVSTPFPPMSIREAAAAVGVTEKTIRRWIQHGRLKAEKIGGQYQISGADLAAAQMATPSAPLSRPTSTHETSGASTAETLRVDTGHRQMSSGVDLRPLVEHIASLEDRVQSLTEAATLWQFRARQLEEQVKQLAAGAAPSDDSPDDRAAPESPQTAEVGSGRTNAPSPRDEPNEPPPAAQKSGFARWWRWVSGRG